MERASEQRNAEGEPSPSPPAQPAPGAPASPVLELIDVAVASLREPSQIVLEEVNWSVAPGDFWVIGGLHRSGKSDFMAVAAGLMRPARGAVRLFGEDLAARPEAELLRHRLRLGLVFDGGQLLSHLTIEQNVALPICYHSNRSADEAAEQVNALLELAGLRGVAQQKPGAIGRNRRQRAGLARALTLKPEVLLLDNPLTGLDPRDAVWWLDLLDQLAAGHPLLEGRPVTLAVTGDDFRPWRHRARQFAVLSERRFVVLGTRRELATHAEPLLQDLLRTEAALG